MKEIDKNLMFFVLIPFIAIVSGIFIIPLQPDCNLWHGVAFAVAFSVFSVLCGIFRT